MTASPHHRRSIRLKGYDYRQQGAYFVTLAACQHQDLFGYRIGDQVTLNEIGQEVCAIWEDLVKHFPLTLDEWLLMPDHLHAILFLEGGDTGRSENGTVRGVASRSLGAIVGNFKSISTRKINQLRHTPGMPVWQRNYYEHILRSERELENIQRYIVENPLRHLLRDTEDFDP